MAALDAGQNFGPNVAGLRHRRIASCPLPNQDLTESTSSEIISRHPEQAHPFLAFSLGHGSPRSFTSAPEPALAKELQALPDVDNAPLAVIHKHRIRISASSGSLGIAPPHTGPQSIWSRRVRTRRNRIFASLDDLRSEQEWLEQRLGARSQRRPRQRARSTRSPRPPTATPTPTTQQGPSTTTTSPGKTSSCYGPTSLVRPTPYPNPVWPPC